MLNRMPGSSDIGLWPQLFEESTRAPLTDTQLEHLYALTDWRVIFLDENLSIDLAYNGIPTASIFKALALPYLINISFERALGRAIIERELLQALCGFLPGKVPTRSTLWYFRAKYAEQYPELMLRVLIAMVLSGKRPRLDLPFVTPLAESVSTPDGQWSQIQLDIYRQKIDVWRSVQGQTTRKPTTMMGKDWVELRVELRNDLERQAEQRRLNKKSLADDLGLPIEVQAQLNTRQVVRFGIDKPRWLEIVVRQQDTLTTIGPSTARPYTACAIIVMREHDGKQQVLLSQRLSGYGSGSYGLPGGKPGPDETIQECATRELKEETGLRLVKSRPISFHISRLPGKPRVTSIGVLAEEYSGDPRRIEPNQNSEWQWFFLDDLPAPLFEPTRIAISQYEKRTGTDLQWSDVESHVNITHIEAEQLVLFDSD